MPELRFRIWTLFALCGLVLLGTFGCDDNTPDPDSLEPWSYQSAKAPYSIQVPGQWTQTPAEGLNRFADLAVRIENQFYLIVIPQQLPQFEGVESPDALDLKRASLGLLKERVSDFKIEREGPLQLGGKTALSVFAEGVNEQEAVQYITTYATHNDWGFQIIAWGPASAENGLIKATDNLLAGWKFKGPAAPTEAKPATEKPTQAATELDESAE